MNNLEQAARQALEALNKAFEMRVTNHPNWEDLARTTIIALNQALENHESAYQRGYLDGMAKPCIDCADRKLQAMKQPKQKPVGVVTGYYAGYPVVRPLDPQVVLCEQMALYTEPPKREWVGLTEEEVRAIDTSEFWNDHTPLDFARVIEAKLKEKNT